MNTTQPFPTSGGDSYWHLTKLLSFVDGLPGDLFHRPIALLAEASLQGRPPLYHILAAPFVLLFGRSESAALTVNSVLYLVLIYSVYKIGVLLKDEKVGFLAAFLAATYPPVVHMSHTFLPTFALVACGALSIWLLLAMVKARTVKSAWLFGASVAVGLLVHPVFLWMVAAPALFSIALAFRGEHRQSLEPSGRRLEPFRFLIRGLLPSGVVFLTVVLSWYMTLGRPLFEVFRTVSEGSVYRGTPHVAAGFPQVEASALWYAKTAPMALSNVLVLYFIIGMVAAMFSRRLDRWILVGSVSISFILLSLQVGQTWMPRCCRWWPFSQPYGLFRCVPAGSPRV